MIKLGVKAKDKVTGFTGIVTGRAEYLTGCNQYGIAPPAGKDGKIPDTMWFDENRLEVVGKGVTIKTGTPKENGGPNRDSPR
jgi:hypothetical protein